MCLLAITVLPSCFLEFHKRALLLMLACFSLGSYSAALTILCSPSFCAWVWVCVRRNNTTAIYSYRSNFLEIFLSRFSKHLRALWKMLVPLPDIYDQNRSITVKQAFIRLNRLNGQHLAKNITTATKNSNREDRKREKNESFDNCMEKHIFTFPCCSLPIRPFMIFCLPQSWIRSRKTLFSATHTSQRCSQPADSHFS